MSAFETDFGNAFADMFQTHFGESITLTYADGTTAQTLTAVQVEDVGALDPFFERTFILLISDCTQAPVAGDVITHDSTPFTVQKARNAGDGTYEIRTRAPQAET